jgi:hypothetical protein
MIIEMISRGGAERAEKTARPEVSPYLKWDHNSRVGRTLRVSRMAENGNKPKK